MNSKRIVFLLLAVIVAGTTAFLARAWLQSERAAIAAQMGGQRPVAKPAAQVLVARAAIRTERRRDLHPAGAYEKTVR